LMLCPQRTDDHAVAASRPPRLTSKISNGGCRIRGAAAELMACPLVTGDGRLATAGGVRCEIRLLVAS
ncbi:hypothetical protein ACIBQ2_07495, partial [Micromonospora sediminimaris]